MSTTYLQHVLWNLSWPNRAAVQHLSEDKLAHTEKVVQDAEGPNTNEQATCYILGEKRTDLAMEWIEYKKTFDAGLQSWAIISMLLLKPDHKSIRLSQQSMKLWKNTKSSKSCKNAIETTMKTPHDLFSSSNLSFKLLVLF